MDLRAVGAAPSKAGLTVVFIHIRNDYRRRNAPHCLLYVRQLGADNLQATFVLSKIYADPMTD